MLIYAVIVVHRLVTLLLEFDPRSLFCVLSSLSIVVPVLLVLKTRVFL